MPRQPSRHDDERPHHVVVFVLDDEAVVHIVLRRGDAGGQLELPGFVLTVSWKPRSSGAGGCVVLAIVPR